MSGSSAARREIATATSHLTGKTINRFAHIYQTQDDLLKKQQMIRVLGQMAGGCIQRCMGCDAINALYVTTYEIDQKHGTCYHERFKKYLTWYQENDLVGNAGQTDVKGDRSKRPSEQADPDLYLRIVERREVRLQGPQHHRPLCRRDHRRPHQSAEAGGRGLGRGLRHPGGCRGDLSHFPLCQPQSPHGSESALQPLWRCRRHDSL